MSDEEIIASFLESQRDAQIKRNGSEDLNYKLVSELFQIRSAIEITSGERIKHFSETDRLMIAAQIQRNKIMLLRKTEPDYFF